MPFALLVESPLGFLVWVLAIVAALSVHEFSHALMGTRLGDPTAERAGRLTLNPVAHIDPIGFLALIFVGFGWGKPVPFNPYNLRNQVWGPTAIAFAGPLANFITATGAVVVLKILNLALALPVNNLLIQFLHLLLVINVLLAVFNLIPIPPLDGSKLLFSLLAAPKYDQLRHKLETRGPFILLLIILLDNFLGIGLLGRLFQTVLSFIYRLV
ncbi:MAG: site-2 protease family protein [Patescibacteria group bacterium]